MEIDLSEKYQVSNVLRYDHAHDWLMASVISDNASKIVAILDCEINFSKPIDSFDNVLKLSSREFDSCHSIRNSNNPEETISRTIDFVNNSPILVALKFKRIKCIKAFFNCDDVIRKIAYYLNIDIEGYKRVNVKKTYDANTNNYSLSKFSLGLFVYLINGDCDIIKIIGDCFIKAKISNSFNILTSFQGLYLLIVILKIICLTFCARIMTMKKTIVNLKLR